MCSYRSKITISLLSDSPDQKDHERCSIVRPRCRRHVGDAEGEGRSGSSWCLTNSLTRYTYSVRKVERAQHVGPGERSFIEYIGLQSTLEADDGREEGRLFSAESVFLDYTQEHVVCVPLSSRTQKFNSHSATRVACNTTKPGCVHMPQLRARKLLSPMRSPARSIRQH